MLINFIFFEASEHNFLFTATVMFIMLFIFFEASEH
ncbi:hypothetical protein ACUXGM_001417, partial [Cytobacillus horneckiae]